MKPGASIRSESKQESMQWTKKERPPKNSRFKSRHRSLWRLFGIVKAREQSLQKRRGKLSRGVLFFKDNASVRTARVSRQALKDTGFSEIEHPPYSLDLAPSDLFSNLKRSYVVVDLLMTSNENGCRKPF
ncbi:hypothetical protein EVAR_8305_1 [Eumeta japonica]|uniref:Mariner Mos1 transposase n=1 Tax=Eumeta variegata TaxID=151549 RepID=A0A4C1YAQ0_EUMVA|nr:hypothetical protein EVAR_8305_1 [Eumeta japonica]